jgi:signal transduction histidine kinase/PAS domain-containing protein
MKAASYLTPPVFDDIEKSRIAALQHVILLAGMLISGLYLVVTLFSGLEYMMEILISAGVAVFMVILFLFNRLGYTRLVSFLVPVVIWVAVTINIVTNGGIRNPAFGGYLIAILIAGFLLNWRWLVAMTLLSLGMGIVLILGENAGWIPSQHSYSLIISWAIGATCFLGSAVLIRLATHSQQRSLERTQYQEAAFRESNRLLYKEMTEHGAVQQKLKQRNQELTALLNIGRHLAATLDMQEICRIMYRNVTLPIFGAPHITVALYDEAAQMINCFFAIVDGEEMDPAQFPPMPLGEGPPSDAIRTGQIEVINLAEIRELLVRQGRFIQVGDDRLSSSALYIPLVAGDKVIGVMNLQHYDDDAFAHANTEFLEALVNNAAVALVNAQLYQQARQEIAERKNTEMALSHSNARLQALLAALPDQALLFDQYGNYHEIIQTAFFGEEPSSLSHHPLTELLPGAAGEVILAAIQRTIETGDPQVVTYMLDNTQDDPVWFEGRSALIPGMLPYQDEPLVLWLARDIASVKAAEAEKLDAERLLLEVDSEKRLLAERENFVSTLSHEFRTPLAIIQSSKNMLFSYLERMTPEVRAEHLERIEEQVDYLTRMIDDLLSLGETKSGTIVVNRTMVNLQAECQRIFDLVRISTYSQHSVIYDARDDLGMAMMDVRLLRQILTNLLSNAIKYSPEDSTIRLQINKDGDSAVFQVIDQGIGMSAEDLKMIFTPFKRGENVANIQGTGLGMAIVKQAVEALGGTIACESQPGKGTTFIVRLPLIVNVSTIG